MILEIVSPKFIYQYIFIFFSDFTFYFFAFDSLTAIYHQMPKYFPFQFQNPTHIIALFFLPFSKLDWCIVKVFPSTLLKPMTFPNVISSYFKKYLLMIMEPNSGQFAFLKGLMLISSLLSVWMMKYRSKFRIERSNRSDRFLRWI